MIGSICTFTPTMGMDKIDGVFAQDVEEYVLNQVLNFPTQRMAVFRSGGAVPIEEYLRSRGVLQ